MAQKGPTYKTEVFVPIRKDSKSFEERQKSIWEEMQERMDKRRREWEEEVDRMRQDFFQLKPYEEGGDRIQPQNVFIDKAGKMFRVSFDVSQFDPSEVSVRTEGSKLMVHAKHEEKAQGKSVCREYSREMELPSHVQPDKLTCTLSKDGVLQVEAPQPSSTYKPIITTDESKKFRISINIGKEYIPQDIAVKTIDRKLLVSARHEEKQPGRSSIKEFSREFDLPGSVDPNLVTAALTDDGQLTVEAPLVT